MRLFILIVFGLISSIATKPVSAEELLTWQDCIDEARENHPDLVSAREKLNQALADKEIIASELLPEVTTDFTKKKTRKSDRTKVNSYEYNITGKQLLFDGFKTVYDVAVADRTARAALYNHAVVSSNVRLRLRTAFVELLEAQALLQIAEDIAQRRKENVELLQLRYEAGREHKGSLLTVQADLAQAEFEVAQAKRNIDIAQRKINKELGRTTVYPVRLKGDFKLTYTDREKPQFEGIVESTPFLRDLVAKKEAARFGVKSEQADFFPTVFGTATAGKADDEWPVREHHTWTLGLSVSYPLYEGGKRIEDIRKARAALRQAEADERSGRDGVLLTLEEEWNALQDAIDNIQVRRKFLEATQERAKIAQAQYSNGLILFDNWIIIEDDLVQAKKLFLFAQADALVAEASWIQAKGGTLGYDEEYNR